MLALLEILPGLFARTESGATLVGNVRDQSGTANVCVKNEAVGLTNKTTTHRQGIAERRYRIEEGV